MLTEPEPILFAMQLLTAPILISIAVISLRSYLRFPNWRLLFLSIAFFILSVQPFFFVFSLFFSPIHFYLISYVTFVLPFALLAIVYNDERRKQSIKITQRQWIVGGLMVFADIILTLYILMSIFLRIDSLRELGVYSDLFWAGVFFSNIGNLLIILIVISLFSYYQVKRSVNTLVVMIGFICLLFSHGLGLLSYFLPIIPMQDPFLGFGILRSFEIAGYIAFLVALVRLKVVR